MLQYRINIIEELKKKGFTTYRIKKENILNQRTMQRFRNEQALKWETIDKLCELLDCQPSDIIEYVPDRKGSANSGRQN